MSTTIESLDLTILTRIFTRLPPPDLMHTELVCKFWKSAHDIACESRRELALFVATYRRDLDDVTRFWYHANLDFGTHGFAASSLKVKTNLKTKHCTALTVKFPNVTRLLLYGVDLGHFSDFQLMLKKWGPKLDTFVWLYKDSLPFDLEEGETDDDVKDDEIKDNDEDEMEFKDIWHELAKLTSLRHLALEFEQLARMDMFVNRVLPRLESLYLGIGYDTKGLRLQKLFSALPRAITRLTLTRTIGDTDHYTPQEEGFTYFDLNKHLSKINPNIFNQLTHFGWHGARFLSEGGVDGPLLQFVTNKLKSVTSLDLNLVPEMMDLRHVVQSLKKLPNLTRVRLSPQCDFMKENVIPLSADEDSDEWNKEYEKDVKPRRAHEYYDRSLVRGCALFEGLDKYSYRTLTQLPSITQLHLGNIELTRWDQFDYFAHSFPNVTELYFEECDLTMKRKRNTTPRNISRRLLLLQTLKQGFKNLKRIHRNGSLLIDFNVETPEVDLLKKVKVLLRKTKRNEDLADFDLDEYCQNYKYEHGNDSDFDFNYGLDYDYDDDDYY